MRVIDNNWIKSLNSELLEHAKDKQINVHVNKYVITKNHMYLLIYCQHYIFFIDQNVDGRVVKQ